MLIIGEKINGTRKSVGQAVLARDADFIRKLAQDQVEAGADFLDVNAGTGPDRDFDDLVWLVQTVQEVVDTPLCLDSPNPKALALAVKHVKTTPILNSISGEEERIRLVLPLVAEYKTKVIALAMDGNGIPKDVEGRLSVLHHLLGETRKAGVPDDFVYVDPLAIAVSTENRGALIACETIRRMHLEYPEVHYTCGLSNISFGMPARALVNRAFLTLMLEAGLDSAIMDPMDRGLIETLFAGEALLAKDRNCLRFNRAFRAGRIGVKPVETTK
jgi:5-methyltetrahydrofolate--homocysteine methyltransferase